MDPEPAWGEDDRFSEWGDALGRRLFPLGELGHGRSFLAIDGGSGIHLVETWVAGFGAMPHALENLILGVAPRRIGGEHGQPDRTRGGVIRRAGRACEGALIPRGRTVRRFSVSIRFAPPSTTPATSSTTCRTPSTTPRTPLPRPHGPAPPPPPSATAAPPAPTVTDTARPHPIARTHLTTRTVPDRYPLVHSTDGFRFAAPHVTRAGHDGNRFAMVETQPLGLRWASGESLASARDPGAR